MIALQKKIICLLLTAICVVYFTSPSQAKMSIDFPLWNVGAGTATGASPSTGAYTNIFCYSDVADSITLMFYSSTGGNFFNKTIASSTANSIYSFLTNSETDFISQVRAIRTQGATSGRTFQSGGLRVVFSNSKRGNLDVVNYVGGLSTLTTGGSAGSAAAYDPVAEATGGSVTSSLIEMRKGNNAGCFVDVILPVLGNASFSIPATQASQQLQYTD